MVHNTYIVQYIHSTIHIIVCGIPVKIIREYSMLDNKASFGEKQFFW